MKDRRAFPAPQVPITPVLSRRALSRGNYSAYKGIWGVKNKKYVSSGRAAIALAFEDAGLTQGDEVLVPAFHCESMVTPVTYVGASPVFYPIKGDTSVMLDACEAKLSARTRAIMVTHYFGFPQKINAIRDFADRHQLLLIEDCAHAYLGGADGKPLGSYGDYAVASTMKFFPVYDGGVLASDTRSLENITLTYPGLAFELKSLITIIERAIQYGRLGWLGKLLVPLAGLKDRVWAWIKMLKGPASSDGSVAPASSDGGFGLDTGWIHARATHLCNQIVKHSDFDEIASARRSNYSSYLEVFSDLPDTRILFSELEEQVVPLIFPLYVENSEHVFVELKQKGVPIWRFGEFLDEAVDENVCPVSIDYSKNLLQFPCHQSLSKAELEWIVRNVKEVILNRDKLPKQEFSVARG